MESATVAGVDVTTKVLKGEKITTEDVIQDIIIGKAAGKLAEFGGKQLGKITKNGKQLSKVTQKAINARKSVAPKKGNFKRRRSLQKRVKTLSQEEKNYQNRLGVTSGIVSSGIVTTAIKIKQKNEEENNH